MFRTLIWFLWFWITLIIGLPFTLRLKYLEKKGRTDDFNKLLYKCVNGWSKSLLKIAGVKVNIQGLENIPKDTAVLFVGNHQGNFDIPIYLALMPTLIGFVAKVELSKIPLVLKWMNFTKCVFIDRDNMRKAGEAIISTIKNLKSGNSMVIFPEGTRSKGDKMNEFKSGSFKIAVKAKTPIVPITMDGSYRIMEHGEGKKIKPSNINFWIHKPIFLEKLSKEEIDNIHILVQNTIESKLPN